MTIQEIYKIKTDIENFKVNYVIKRGGNYHENCVLTIFICWVSIPPEIQRCEFPDI